MEIKDGRLVCLRRCLPSNQRDAIGGRDLDLLDAIEAGLRRCSAGRIGEVHESAGAQKSDHAKHPGDPQKPKKKFYKFSPLTKANPPQQTPTTTWPKKNR